MRNSILAGIAAIAMALGLGALITASYESRRMSYGLNVIEDGRASVDEPTLDPESVSNTIAR